MITTQRMRKNTREKYKTYNNKTAFCVSKLRK